MSVILRPRSIACSATGLSARRRSGRSLAAALTGGAALLALLLAATIPARAESPTVLSLTQVPIISYLGQ